MYMYYNMCRERLASGGLPDDHPAPRHQARHRRAEDHVALLLLLALSLLLLFVVLSLLLVVVVPL